MENDYGSAGGASALFKPITMATLPAANPDVDPTRLARKFGHDTAVGQMLKQLYGKQAYVMPEVKLKQRPMDGPQPNMIGTLSRPGNADPRKRTINREAIAEIEANKPPAVTVKEVHVAPIEAMKGHIRSKSVIDKREREAAARGDIKCAPIRPGRNTEREKDKLNLLFALKGGRALPEAGMGVPMDGPLPLALLTGKPGPGSLARARQRAASEGPGGGASSEPTSELLDEYRVTYRELNKALEEARAYWDEVKELQGGALKPSQAREAAAEEDQRVEQLKRIVAGMKEEKARLAKMTS